MQEFLQSISTSDWFVALIAYLTANLGTIIIAVVKAIANKNQNMKLQKKMEEREAEHVKELEELRKELLQYGRDAIDEQIKKENEKLESKATDMTAVVADTQIKVELNDVL